MTTFDKQILIGTLWLAGSVVGYFAFRNYMKQDCAWTKRDRAFNILFSLLLSWAWALPALPLCFVYLFSDKPAKW